MHIDPPESALEALLQHLKVERGFDFTGYKRSTLIRRLRKRITSLGIEDFERYRDYLQANPDEAGPLFDTLLINVTAFFRDTEACQFLAQTVIPQLLAHRDDRDPIRVWSAGCASGEEPFTVAMLLADALGLKEYGRRVKIYATDLDEAALEQARRGRYSSESLESVPERFRRRFFAEADGCGVIESQLRRSVIFGRHDLVQDAPIPHLDLLVCRNVLMYFNADLQSRILGRFHFALEEHGFLFLGRAEMLLSHQAFFAPVELKHRMFHKVSRAPALHTFAPATRERLDLPHDESSRHAWLRQAALEAAPVAQIVVDEQRRVALFNHQAELLFRLGTADFGKPLQDLELSYRPLELRSLIDEAEHSGGIIERQSVEWRLAGEQDSQFLDVIVTPLQREGRMLGMAITFNDVTHRHVLQLRLQRSGENLETAYEELQASNEELETTNEELQSSNEELETTNEELQAANEEMETINEELRSTNEEYSRSNEQLREHEADLERTNSFLHAILGSLSAGVAVLDSNLRVTVWNGQARDLWGLRDDEALGTAIGDLDIGLPIDDLMPQLRKGIDGDHDGSGAQVIEAIDRRGRPLRCEVQIAPLHDGGSYRGVIMFMERLGDGAADGAAADGGGSGKGRR